MSSPVKPSQSVMRRLGWLDGAPSVLLFLLKRTEGGPFLKIYPCFPRRSQQEAGDRSTDARTGVDPWGIVYFWSLGPRQRVSGIHVEPRGPAMEVLEVLELVV